MNWPPRRAVRRSAFGPSSLTSPGQLSQVGRSATRRPERSSSSVVVSPWLHPFRSSVASLRWTRLPLDGRLSVKWFMNGALYIYNGNTQAWDLKKVSWEYLCVSYKRLTLLRSVILKHGHSRYSPIYRNSSMCCIITLTASEKFTCLKFSTPSLCVGQPNINDSIYSDVSLWVNNNNNNNNTDTWSSNGVMRRFVREEGKIHELEFCLGSLGVTGCWRHSGQSDVRHSAERFHWFWWPGLKKIININKLRYNDFSYVHLTKHLNTWTESGPNNNINYKWPQKINLPNNTQNKTNGSSSRYSKIVRIQR